MNNIKTLYEKYDEETALHHSLMKHYEHVVKGGDDADMAWKSPIQSHAESSQGLNSYLWDAHAGKVPRTHDDGHGAYDAYEERLAGALNHSLQKYKTPHSFNVYSNTRHDPRKIMDHNNIVHHPAFISTSISPFRAIQHNNVSSHNNMPKNHILKIHVPKGHAGYYVPGLKAHGGGEHLTDYPEEKEFILPSGLNLRHVKTTQKKYINSKIPGMPDNVKVPFEPRFIHHMEIV